MKKYLTDSINIYKENVVFYFMVFFIVKIIIDHCGLLVDKMLNKLGAIFYFFFYLSTVEITKDFRDSRCDFQVIYGLYLHIKL